MQAALRRRRMFHRELGVAGLVDFDHECDSPFRIAHGEWLARVLVGHGIHELEVGVGPALDDPTAELSLRVGIVEVHDG